MKIGIRTQSLALHHCAGALSHEFWAGVPLEDIYTDDLVTIANSLEKCVMRFLIWKEAMEKKVLGVNAGKTAAMICGTGLDLLQSSGVPMRCLSYRSRQQQHLLQLLQTLSFVIDDPCPKRGFSIKGICLIQLKFSGIYLTYH